MRGSKAAIPPGRAACALLVLVLGCNGAAQPETTALRLEPLTFEGASCSVVYTVASRWSGGFGVNVEITNKLGAPLHGWRLEWDWPAGETITQIWNADATLLDGHVTVTNLAWNGSLAAGATVAFGFNGVFATARAAPPSISPGGVPLPRAPRCVGLRS